MNTLTTEIDDFVCGIAEKTYTHEEVWRKMEKKMNAHYGTNYKFNLKNV
jgi:hypothetical protein